jgi:hypothetical protein
VAAATGAFETFNDARLAAFSGTGAVAMNPVINRYIAAN